ncbi:MAG: hypothetical protein KDB74_08310 [Flavobacteriales bacterium]|nr:hypothetical protein [Flavobacteriales bacterium]
MTIQELLNDPIINLPKKRGNNSFENFTTEIFNSYHDKLGKLEDYIVYGENKRKIDCKLIKRKSLSLSKELIKAVKEYLFGKPHLAFKIFKTIVDNSELSLNFQHLMGGENFYRVRYLESNYSLNKEQLFHIPFELKGKVKTQRYSIPGFPCLYLSDSIYTCWEELKKPDIYKLHGSRLELKSNEITNILVIPLPKHEIDKFCTDDGKIVESSNGAGIDSLLINWPLYFFCSILVKSPEDHFKPEYIIPQLLLQYIRDESKIHGVKYFSTNIDYSLNGVEGAFYNYVFPVRHTAGKGLCQDLSKRFLITEPIPFGVIKNIDGGGAWLNSGRNELSPHVKKIEFIKGFSTQYSYSLFGTFERYLNNAKTVDIEDRG